MGVTRWAAIIGAIASLVAAKRQVGDGLVGVGQQVSHLGIFLAGQLMALIPYG